MNEVWKKPPISLADYQGMVGLKPIMSISKRLAVSTFFDK